MPGTVFNSTSLGVDLYNPPLQNPATIASGATITNIYAGVNNGDAVYGDNSVAWTVYNFGTAEGNLGGASGVMVVSERALKEHGLTPLARIHNLTLIGHDPVIMLEAPLPATERALKRAGMSIDDIDLFEVNEAFASVPVAWLQTTGADPAKLNVNGGAIALGHPLGASGTKLMTTLLYALKARGKTWGLQTMCEGGGLANVTIVERL